MRNIFPILRTESVASVINNAKSLSKHLRNHSEKQTIISEYFDFSLIAVFKKKNLSEPYPNSTQLNGTQCK